MRGAFNIFKTSLYKALRISSGLFLLACLLLTSLVHATPSYNSDLTVGTSTSSNSFTVSSCTDQVLFVFIQSENDGAPSAVAYNGTAMTAIGAFATNSTSEYIRGYYLVAPSSGTHNVTITGWGGSPVRVEMFTYCSVNQSSPIGATAVSSGTAAGPPFTRSTSITPTDASSRIVQMFTLQTCSVNTTQTLSVGTARAANGGGIWNTHSFGLSDYAPGSTSNYTVNHGLSGGGGCGGSGQLGLLMELMPDVAAPTATVTPAQSPTQTPLPGATATPSSGCTVSYNSDASDYPPQQWGGSLSWSWTNGGSSNTVMFLVLHRNASNAGSQTFQYNGVSMTQLFNLGDMAVYYLVNPAAGTHNITNSASNYDLSWIDVFSYDGVTTTDPFSGGNYATASGSGTTLDVNITPVNSAGTILALLYGANHAPTAHTITGGSSRHVVTASQWGVTHGFGFGDRAASSGSMTISQAFNAGSGTIKGAAIELNPCGPQPTKTPTPTNTPYQSPTITPTRTRTPSNTPFYSPTFTRTYTLTYTRTLTPTPTRSFTASPIVSATNTPIASATTTLTPQAVPMTKSINVGSASIGDTITYCISWTNQSGGSTAISVWDTVPIVMAYLSCWAQSGALTGCSYNPRVVLFNIGASVANGASGTVCFNAVITGYPWLPGADLSANLAWWQGRDDELLPWKPTLLLDGGRR